MTKESDAAENLIRDIFERYKTQLGYDHVTGKADHPTLETPNDVVNVDATAWLTDGKKVIIEVRKRKGRVKANEIKALYYDMQDLGAVGGIMVTFKGFQKGAIKRAKVKKIGMATFNAGATIENHTLDLVIDLFHQIFLAITDTPLEPTEELHLQGNLRLEDDALIPSDSISFQTHHHPKP